MRKITFFRVLGLMLFLLLLGSIQLYASETMTVTGEIIDTYCYSLMGAKGASHRDCAIECAKKGIPVGILEENTNKVFVLLPNKDKTAYPKAVFDKMAQKVTITGKMATIGGSQFLTIESIK